MKQDYDTIPIPISIRQKDGRYTYVNKAWSDMFSVENETVCGKTDKDLCLDPLAIPEGEPGSVVGEYAFRDVYITTRDKGRLLLELIETRVSDEKDTDSILCVHQDMTGIGWRMEDITRSLSRCEFRSRQSIQNAVRMSHDMCEPLEQLVRYCDLLAGSSLSKQQSDWLSVVRDNSHVLLKQIQRNSDIIDVTDDEEEHHDEAVIIAELVNEVTAIYETPASERGVKMEVHIGKEFDAPVILDRIRARQILVNMMDSAIRGSKKGAVKICASYVAGSDKPLCLKVRVEQPNNFTRENGDNSLPKIGIGLSHRIVRGLCGMMGGRFEISSETDGARTMRVYLHAPTAMKNKSIL